LLGNSGAYAVGQRFATLVSAVKAPTSIDASSSQLVISLNNDPALSLAVDLGTRSTGPDIAATLRAEVRSGVAGPLAVPAVAAFDARFLAGFQRYLLVSGAAADASSSTGSVATSGPAADFLKLTAARGAASHDSQYLPPDQVDPAADLPRDRFSRGIAFFE